MSRIVSLALNAADHLASKGRLDAAASILRNYLSTNQPDGAVMQRLGRIYMAQGRAEEAVHLLQQALVCFQSEEPAKDAVIVSNPPMDGATVDEAAPAALDSMFIAAH